MWRPSPRAQARLVTWGGEWVCHHALANDTHRLSELAGCVLDALAERSPQTMAELTDALDADDEALAETLETLAALDLVERVA